MASTNYGVVLKASGSPIAEVTKLDFPELKNPAVDVTNHGSGGYKNFISSGLKELPPFKATISGSASGLNVFKTNWSNGTAANYEINFPTSSGIGAWTFPALVTSIKFGESDAKSPDQLVMEVEFTVSGSPTLA